MKNTLLIDTSKANIVSVSLITAEKELKKESEQKFGSQVLLILIEEVLREEEIELKDLTEIKVATGPGSFTGLRVGAAVANALGFSLGIPVNGKKTEVDLEYA